MHRCRPTLQESRLTPARSRHCGRECPQDAPGVRISWEGVESAQSRFAAPFSVGERGAFPFILRTVFPDPGVFAFLISVSEVRPLNQLDRSYLKIALPASLEGVFMTLLASADLIMVGVLGTESVAAVGILPSRASFS